MPVDGPRVGDPHEVAVDLTDKRYGPGHWPACHHPERAPDDMCIFVTACPQCALMIHAALTIRPPEGSGIYPGWWRDRTQFQAMLARRRVKVIARKPDLAWRGMGTR